MGISLSNKDYIAFTIKKKKKEKRHDYDVTADYNKTIIKEPRKREKKREKKWRKRNTARVLLTRPPRIDCIARWASGGAGVPDVYAVRTLIKRLDRY